MRKFRRDRAARRAPILAKEVEIAPTKDHATVSGGRVASHELQSQ